MPEIKTLELYSGIGGFHQGALKFNAAEIRRKPDSPTTIKVAHSFDYDFTCRKIYEKNYPGVRFSCRKLEDIALEEYQKKFQAELVMMSPPCQPFTRNGLKLDDQDARTASFFHLLNEVSPGRQRSVPTHIQTYIHTSHTNRPTKTCFQPELNVRFDNKIWRSEKGADPRKPKFDKCSAC